MIRKTLKYFLSTLLLIPLAGCVNEDAIPAESGKRGDITLRLNVITDLDGNAQSRADLGDQDKYEPALKSEEIATLRVIVLHGNNREVEGARMVATKEDGTPINDNLEFKVNSGETKTIILIANEASLPDISGMDPSKFLDQFIVAGTKIDDTQWKELTQWRASFSGDSEPNATTSIFYNEDLGDVIRIPLTEIFEVDTRQVEAQALDGTGTDDQDAEEKQEVTLFMTRAAAKASFHFNSESKKWSGQKVTGIKISGLNWTEYVFPQNATYSPSKYVNDKPGTVNEDTNNGERYITSFTNEDCNGNATFTYNLGDNAVEIKNYGNEPASCGPIYFPESKMTAASEQYMVSVQIDGGDWLDAQPLETNILNIGGCNAIARNTYLKIYITFGEHNITWEAIEAPYNSVTLDPVFGL